MGSGLILSDENKANLVKSCFLLRRDRGKGQDPTTACLAASVWDAQGGLFSSHSSMTLSIKLIAGYLYCHGCHHQFFSSFTRAGLRKKKKKKRLMLWRRDCSSSPCGFRSEEGKKKSLLKTEEKEKQEINNLRRHSGRERKITRSRGKGCIKEKSTASQKDATITKAIRKGLAKRG